MRITEEEIKRISSATIYRRGVEFYREGRIHLRVRDTHEIVSVADAEELYNVGIHFDDDGHVLDSFCTCAYFRTMECTCKHIVATLKARQEELEEGENYTDENDRLAKKVCADFDNLRHEKIHLNLSVVFRVTNTPSGMKYSASLAVGEGRPEQISGIETFLAAYRGEGEYKLSKFRAFSRDKYEFSENDSQILDILAESSQNRTSAGEMRHKLSFTEFGAFTAKRLIPYLVKAKTDFIINDMRLSDMQVKYEDPDILLDVNADGFTITLSAPESGTAIIPDGSWFLFSQDIYSTTEQWRDFYMPIYRALSDGTRTQIDFSGENSIAFASAVLPQLRGRRNVALQGVDDVVVDEHPTFDVYFDMRGLAVNAVVIANYGSIGLRLPSGAAKQGNKIVVRNPEAENAILKFFGAFRFDEHGYYLDDNDEIYKFIFSELALLEKEANIIQSNSFAAVRKSLEPKIGASVSYRNDIDLLEFKIDSPMSPEEIEGILGAVRLKKNYFRTKSGQFLNIDESDSMLRFLSHIEFDAKEIKTGTKMLSKYHALYLESLANSGRIKREESFGELIERVKDIRADIPGQMLGILRAYQQEAVHWMTQLDELGFGGILADDMGLGKTLEVIAFVMSSKREKPAIVVAPSALLYNWKKEIARFAPSAKAIIIDGAKAERERKIADLENVDFVITSYSLLRRDSALYSDMEFSYCFIDEAQYIKNPKTMNARGVKKIKASRRFALTGTPIENTLIELWSIFDFVMPGYLDTRRHFSELYEKQQENWQEVSGLLRARIKPFVMRRMKSDVLAELPEKIEETVYAELMPEQKKLYEAYLSVAKKEVRRMLDERNSGVMILSILTRLRQICCHPALFDDNYTDRSGKLEVLCELLLSAISGGHRILVFSQFTSMLKIIRKELDARGIMSFYLDGATPPSERAELSDRFNGGERSVFLISLKAGGTGLNLVGADMVIHYDPWWNPAVTDQASDRAYRIGQKRAVLVIRLVTSGTIEEQILKLQDKKRALADGVIIKNSATLSNLTNDEILSLFES